MKTNLEIALGYRARGWSIIPIKAGSKSPAIAAWKEYQKIRPSESEIKSWWSKYPKAGIALICGKISGVIVVDIDAKSGGKETAASIHLPITLATKTGGGGNHYIYQWRAGLVGAKVGIKKGIDIRSDNSYVVLPPTMHESGKRYEWINEDEEIGIAPNWLNVSGNFNDDDVEGESTPASTDWEKFFKDKKGQGMRNMSATQLAGKILFDMSPELWDTLGVSCFKQWNREYNTPPLPDRELATVWASVKSTHIKNNKPPESGEESGLPVSDELAQEKELYKMFAKDKQKGTFYLAKYMTEKFDIITVGEKEREMYVYRNGMYFQAENEIIYPEIQRILGHHVTKQAKTETFHKIADMTSHPRSVFQEAPIHCIPLQNGVYDRLAKKLLPHDSKYRFTYQFPVVYNPQSYSTKTLAFFEQILTDIQRPTIQEWLGYYFYRLYAFKKAIIFVGEGDTGKTTLLETINHLIGKENISSVSLQKMTGDKFAAAHLYEKHGNLVDELSAKDISDTGNFKIATGGGSIAGEYKFGNQFQFHNFSKFTFACNKIPDVKDFSDEAYFNRWMVIRFENIIEKKIPNFIQSLTTEEERSGLFNYAMEGLDRLLSQGAFTYGKNAIDTKLEMMRSGSSIAQFVSEKIEQSTGAEMSKEDMYEAYTAYCGSNNVPAETIKMFGTKFLFYVSYATDGLINDHKNGRPVRVRGWRNVSIIKEGEAAVSDQSAEDAFNGF